MGDTPSEIRPTGTPIAMTDIPALVAELRSGARDWDIAVAHEIDTYGSGTEDAIGMADRAAMYRRAADALSALAKDLEEARAERDEADRRAGAAERDNANRRSSDIKRQDWLDERKRSLGYDIGVSFDRVWDDTLAKACRLDEALAALTAAEAREGELRTDRDSWRRVAERLEEEKQALRAALEPLGRLEIPARPQGNAGAYSIRHDDIRRARAVLATKEMGR